MTTRILITGGAGFIGSRLMRALLRDIPNSEIWIIDNLHPQVHGENASPPKLPENVHFYLGDVASAEAMQKIVSMARPHLVYHLAAETGTGQSYDEPTRYCSVNIIGTTNLIEALRLSVDTRRVVLAASRAIYGEGAYLDAMGNEFVGLPRLPLAMSNGDFSVPLPKKAVLPASAIPSHSGLAPAPASIYASTKLMQEYLLIQGGEGADWDLTALRFQNVYGPGQSLRNPYTGVLSIFARQLLDGKTLAIFEDGDIARDFVYVDDVVSALVLAGQKVVPHGTILDIGSGQAITILETAKILMRFLGKSESLFTITGDYRIGDIRHACADNTAATERLGWLPKISVSDGLKLLAEWAVSEYESNRL